MGRDGLIAGYLVGVNLLAFLLMGSDKRRAQRRQERFSERSLFLLPLLGGALGGTLGMAVFHHKTRHWWFRVGFPALLAIQAAALWAFATWG